MRLRSKITIDLENVTPSKRKNASESVSNSKRKQPKTVLKEDNHISDDEPDTVTIEANATKTPVKPKGTPSKATPSKAGTPVKAATPRTPSSVLQEGKGLFRRSCTPSRLIGRESERLSIRTFINECLEKGASSLYISGTPGMTCLSKALAKALSFMKFYKDSKPISLHEYPNLTKVQSVSINCMNVSSAKLVYRDLCKELGLWNGQSADDCIPVLEKLFISTKSAGNKKDQNML
jgi:cell division control protein 6